MLACVLGGLMATAPPAQSQLQPMVLAKSRGPSVHVAEMFKDVCNLKND